VGIWGIKFALAGTLFGRITKPNQTTIKTHTQNEHLFQIFTNSI